jgi:O-antigen ligase
MSGSSTAPPCSGIVEDGMSASQPVRDTADRYAEAGVFLAVVAVPLIFVPFTVSPLTDVKLVFLGVAALLLALSGTSIDRRIAWFAATWVAVLALAAALGLDPWWSFVGPELEGTGVIALAICALFLCYGSGLEREPSTRAAAWLFWTASIVSAFSILARVVAPSTAFLTVGGVDAIGSIRALAVGIVGHRVYAGGFIAAGALAATERMPTRWRYAGLVLIGSGLAVTAVRSAWLGYALGIAVVALRARSEWRTLLRVAAPVIVVMGVWTLAGHALPKQGIEYSAAPRFTQLDEGSAQQRLQIWKANARAWKKHPVLGTGTGTAWYAFLSNASPSEVHVAGRNNADAHNIVLEMATSAGAVGVLAFLALLGAVVWYIRGAPSDVAWAAAAAIALFTVHLFQPLNLRLTPLLFLYAGIAMRRGSPRPVRRVHAPIVVFSVLASLVATAVFLSSAFEWYGSTFASESALRWSLRFDPRRLGALTSLAGERAFDGENDPSAKREVRSLLRRAVHQHDWNPDPWIAAADLSVAIGDRATATRYAAAGRARFPNDPLEVAAAAVLALQRGDRAEAGRLARLAEYLDPALSAPKTVLDSLKRSAPR